MRARVVDWALLALVLLGVATGLWSFLVGDAQGYWLFVGHGALGLATLGVLAAKLRRVTPKVLATKGIFNRASAGVLTAVAALLTVGIGVWWAVTQTPVPYPNGMILHTTAGFVLLGLCIWHLFERYRPLTKRDVSDRRSALRLLAILAGGGALWAGIEQVQRMARTPGSVRRFTGSRNAHPALPVTMWMLDRPAPVDLDSYFLEIAGAVAKPIHLDAQGLREFPLQTLVATLDCTGGWYSEQAWQGLRLGDLLAAAQPLPTAHFVRLRSVTGYRWSLPLDEAIDALLATHVGGKLLTHGNGAPLRLVAPGRRGFQWVKWVVAVEVLDAPDIGQWAAIFSSGLDGA